MKILFGLIYTMDPAMQFMYIFLPCSMIVLTVLHHFLKEHIKIWFCMCLVPTVVYAIFLSLQYYVGNPELTINRYVAFGIVTLLIALWGLAILCKRSFKAYTIIVMSFSVVILLGSVIAIWAVWLRPNVTNCSHLGWTESFEGAIDTLEKEYVLNEWKEIDYDRLRDELIPKVQEAERNNDELAYVYALYELKYEFADGHVTIRGDMACRNEAMARYAGNDYGFSMFRTDTDEIIAILVDDDSKCSELGIHNGSVITKWNGVPIEEALENVKCIDREYSIQTAENIRIAQPIFLAGLSDDNLTVSFLDDGGSEQTVTLKPCGEYINRRSEELRILFGENVVSSDNYSLSMLDDHIGYLRITEEEYSLDPLFITKCTITGYSKEIADDLDSGLEGLRAQGMDQIIIDLRNNDGGNEFEARTVASLFTSEAIPYYLSLYSNGQYKVVTESSDIDISDIEVRGKWSDLPVVVLVNGQTKSAGEILTNYLKDSENVTIIGNTTTWGNAQGTGGSVVLSGGKYEIRFPITPTLNADGQPAIDATADRNSRIPLDYKIAYSTEDAVLFFEDSDKDTVLEKVVEYMNQQ